MQLGYIRIMTTMTKTAAEFETALATYLTALNAASVADYAVRFPTLSPTTYSVEKGGRKYIRIIATSQAGASRSVHVFVEKATGLIWKADGWKSPTLNFSRGSIYELSADVLRTGR